MLLTCVNNIIVMLLTCFRLFVLKDSFFFFLTSVMLKLEKVIFEQANSKYKTEKERKSSTGFSNSGCLVKEPFPGLFKS